MLSFLAKHPPRSTICGLTCIKLDGGRSIAEFKQPRGQDDNDDNNHNNNHDSYLVINRLPPSEAQKKGLPHQGATSSLAPPLHRHLWQDETFHVISGTAKFTMGSRQQGQVVKLASEGEVVVIPRRQAHTFCNASEESDLVIEFALQPANPRTDEAYFRELLTGPFSFFSPFARRTLFFFFFSHTCCPSLLYSESREY